MKNSILRTLFLASLLAAPQIAWSQLPPLIAREVFFGDPDISGAQLSPDGEWIAFRKPYNDVMNVYVKSIDEPFESAKPVTADDRPVPGYFWSEDSRYILYVQDKGGNENFNVYAVDPAAAPEAETGVPPARNLTPIDGVRASIVHTDEDRPNELIVGLNDRDPQLHDLYRVDIRTGERELLFKNEQNILGWDFDLDGNLRLATRMDPETGDVEIHRIMEDQTLEEIYSCGVLESCGVLRFHPDGTSVYLLTNKGSRDLAELVRFDLATGQETLIEKDPENQSDFAGAVFSDKTDELLATYYIGDRVRIYPHQKEFADDLDFLKENLPAGDIYPGGVTRDERKMLVTVTRDVDPGSVYLFDRDERTVTKLYTSRPELPSENLAEMKAVRYVGRDGLEIPAYLTLPAGVEARNLPAVVLPHGGPWARDVYGYSSGAQFLANRGYAVLQPNFRGSTGYGKSFLNAGNYEWGTGAMQHDISDAVKYLVDEGIADPKRVAILGGSYGGYATLAGLAFTPELYAAGVDIVGPSNLFTLIESFPPYWRPALKMWHERLGDPENPEHAVRLREQSPLFSADKIEDPLLVIQGANDPRVKKHESDQIVVALRDRGFPIEYIVAPDEGHGFRGETNQLAMWAAIEKFLANHIGGRYQEDMTDETATRLQEITVDPSTVTLPEPVEETSGDLPKPAFGLVPGTDNYQVTFNMGGQQMNMELSRTVEEVEGGWRVTEKAKGPMGEVSDIETLSKPSLTPVQRTTSQGPVKIEISYTDSKAEGTFSMGGTNQPISADLGGPIFSDGAGANLVIAALPLTEGYAASYRTLDLMTQKVKPMKATVTDVESITVPAGTFDAFRVEVAAADGSPGASTIWVAKDSRKVVKTEATVPQAGNATITAELLPAGSN